jgi:hypothetical protein
MYAMADAIMKISASMFAFFFAYRFTIATNQASQGVIRGENAGVKDRVTPSEVHPRSRAIFATLSMSSPLGPMRRASFTSSSKPDDKNEQIRCHFE